MKRLFIITLAILTLSATQASAQKWLNLLKTAATTIVDEATQGQLTALAIIGEWNYFQPSVRLSSDKDVLSELTAAAITSSLQTKLIPYYETIGINSDMCKFVFNEDGTFASTFGKNTYVGTYTFEPTTNQLALKYGAENSLAALFDMGSVPAFAYINGGQLQIVFTADKLLAMITSLGSNISSLSSFTSLIKNYNGLKIGFELSKNQQ